MQDSGFFNGDRYYGQEEFNRYFDQMFYSGVAIDDDGNMTLKVTGGSGNATVAPGFAILKGFWYLNDSNLTVSVTPPSSGTRIDRLVIRADLFAGPAVATLKKGSASAAPALVRNEDYYEISLAQLKVTADGTVTVTDERPKVDVCGAIRPKNMTEYRDMIKALQNQFDEWFASIQGTVQRNIFIQPDTPEGSVAGSIWIQTQ